MARKKTVLKKKKSLAAGGTAAGSNGAGGSLAAAKVGAKKESVHAGARVEKGFASRTGKASLRAKANAEASGKAKAKGTSAGTLSGTLSESPFGTQSEARLAWVLQIINGLKREYPEAHCYLNFETPFQLLIATILSAQCTDDRVNKVTPALFKRFPDASSMAKGKLPEIEKLIQTAGFFRMKAKSLSETSQALVENYGGELPRELEKLTALRGVGRKTANVVLGNAFGIPGMVVDTHVGRLTRRMGMTTEEDPVKVEADLEKLVPREDWVVFSHLLIAHGRAICTSRRAKCDECFLSRFCEKRL